MVTTQRGLIILFCFFLVLLPVSADRLPNQTPENQVFSIDTVLDITGQVDDDSSLHWVVASPGAIPTGILSKYQTIADVTYSDAILTNGGTLAENKNFAFDSRDKAKGLFNIETEKVLTYASTEGAHLVGEETLILDVAGNYSKAGDSVRCVFSASSDGYVPAFCNVVSAKSSLINVNSAQVSTKGQIRSIAQTYDIPAELNYRIAVSPDSNSGSGFAEGTVATTFAGSIMEAREVRRANWNKTSATNTWKDVTSVTGGIKNLQKVLNYQSEVNGELPGNPGTSGIRVIPDQDMIDGFAAAMAELLDMGLPSDWTVNIAVDGKNAGSLWVDPNNFKTDAILIENLEAGPHTITSVGVDPNVNARVPEQYRSFTVDVPEGEIKDVPMHFPKAA